ncbi:TolC family outer membrane protein [Halomonas elongata]|uniref:Homolog to outer membrane protein TolC n=1 Tax=Halomonas elongata (strain ATCC 33173 / DSM 2581 / NBRC 15536 / NCIMB 2198 / 1H9) TaxID=768066 RepID=E1V6M6_HALED|nr:TolC family outer membrane protein [Halomonas elongata]WBF18590.1 TolC family outer membrane protein [Halomonas elongata]WPU47444.1 TolC family outer membrane protein [Halomonas elongata DSM 2581]CBV41355.1 homolog to outer membrane protein TolC [Halomonas elongata DSM 2581]
MRRFPLSPLAAAMVLLFAADVTLAGTQASPSSFLGRVETREAAIADMPSQSTGGDAAIWQEANTALSGPADAQMTGGAGSAAADTISIPSLPGLFERALNADADLQAQRLRAEARGQDVPKARAGLLPRLDASYVYRYTDSDNIYTDGGVTTCETNPDTGEPVGGDTYERRCAGESTDSIRQLELTQPLFSMSRIRQMQHAEAQRDQAMLRLAVAERDLALKTSQTYLDAFFASRRARLLEGKRASLELQLAQARKAYELGIGDRIDLLAARSALDSTRADIVLARNETDDALATLERLTGVRSTFDGFSLATLTGVEFAEPAPLETLEGSIDSNAGVEAAREGVRVAEADVALRKAGYYPEVSLNLSWRDRNSNDPYLASEEASAAIQARLNLFRGGYTRADMRQGELMARASRSDVDGARRQALEQLRQSRRGIIGEQGRLAALAQSIRSGELYLEAADKGAALGLRDLVDVLDARAKLFDQRIQYVDAFRRLLLNRLQMQAAVGDLSGEDLADVMSSIQQIIGPPRPIDKMPDAWRHAQAESPENGIHASHDSLASLH